MMPDGVYTQTSRERRSACADGLFHREGCSRAWGSNGVRLDSAAFGLGKCWLWVAADRPPYTRAGGY